MPPAVVDLTHTNCVSYLRVSTESQAGEKQTSLTDQERGTTALATKLGASIGHVFRDAGFSGATIEHRPAMRALVASCEASPRTKRRPGYVVVLNDSRWGRFPDSEEATYWRHHLARFGWIVRFVEQDEVDDDMLRPVLRTISQTQASLFRKTLQANTRRGARGTAEQGYWQAMAPFGYFRAVVYPADRQRVLPHDVPKATDEKLSLAINPDEAPIVKAIFARYAGGGESINSLLTWAIRAYPTRCWTRPAILRMLSNPAYVGDVVWGRVERDLGRKTERPESAWYGKPDAHPAIVSRELFAQAQARLRVNRHRTRGVRSDWVLSGLVRCRCGRNLTGGGIGGGGEPVYMCSTRRRVQALRCPYPGAVTKRLLEDAVVGVLAKELSSALHRRGLVAALDAALADAKARARSEDAIMRDLASIEERRSRLVAAIEAGTLTTTDAQSRMRALRESTEALEREREIAARGATDLAAWRHVLVERALDFKTMAATLSGPALRELVAPWLARAEFNTTTRELLMEIRRIPAASGAASTAVSTAVPVHFGAEREGSGSKSKRPRGLQATVIRRVIVGRVA